MSKPYNPYKKLGVRRVINASTTMTRLGGSKPHPEIFKAMEDASKAFVHIPTLQVWAGKKIAEIMGVEAGHPTACAVNSLVLAVAACMMKGTELESYHPLDNADWTKIAQKLPLHTEDLKTEFIVLGDSRSEYDHAIEVAGGRIVVAGSTEGVTVDDLREAYHEGSTAAYYYTLQVTKNQMPLKTFSRIARETNTPVIVDAAPNITHNEIPQKLIEDGADLIIFSGGKHIGGINNTGLLVGKKELVNLAHLQSYPFDGIGRGAKMSREMIVGLIKALELFYERDDEAHWKQVEKEAYTLAEKLGKIKGIRSGVTYEPIILDGKTKPAYAYIELDHEKISLKELHMKLKEGDPWIETLYEPFFITPEAKDKITLKTEFLLEGDDELIIKRVKEILEN